MSDLEVLAGRFEQDRAHLRAVAQRILGSEHEADDAVQEAWVRLSRSDTSDVGNLTGWLTTVVSRVCLDMLRSRSARRKVQGTGGGESTGDEDAALRRTIVDAFLAASRGGDFARLLALLDPGVVMRADAAGVKFGAEALVRGADAVAATFSGRAKAARLALIDGAPGVLWSAGGTPRVAFTFTIEDGRITAIDLLADPETLTTLTLQVLD
jgi:hypothetical protein